MNSTGLKADLWGQNVDNHLVSVEDRVFGPLHTCVSVEGRDGERFG